MASFWRHALFLYRASGRFTKSGYEKQQPLWEPDAVSFGEPHRLSILRVIVTGANAGLGRATAERLARMGCCVIMICRDLGRGEQARREIEEATGNPRVELEIADVSLLSSVRQLATRLLERNLPVHALVNNAGVLLNVKEETSEGLDRTLLTNYLGPFLLTDLLTPLLLIAQQQSGEPSRVVHVSSGGMYTQSLEAFVDDFQFERMGRWDGSAAYSRTKRAQVCLAETQALQHPHRDAIAFFSCHPGWADSPGLHSSLPAFRDRLQASLRSLDQGADTIVWLAVSPQVGLGHSGCFFEDRVVVPQHLWLAGTAAGCTDASHARLLHLSTDLIHTLSHGELTHEMASQGSSTP